MTAWSVVRGVFDGICHLYNISVDFNSSYLDEDEISRNLRESISRRVVALGVSYNLHEAHPEFCLTILGIIFGILIFILVYILSLGLRGFLYAVTSATGIDLLKDFVGVEDTNDALPENPFWAGTHARRKMESQKKEE
jgi:hypothetical protein